jgi:hypothetical protein
MRTSPVEAAADLVLVDGEVGIITVLRGRP